MDINPIRPNNYWILTKNPFETHLTQKQRTQIQPSPFHLKKKKKNPRFNVFIFFIFQDSKHFSLSPLAENNGAQQTHFSMAIRSTFSKSKARKFKPATASFTDAWIRVAQGFDLDLKPFFIASD